MEKKEKLLLTFYSLASITIITCIIFIISLTIRTNRLAEKTHHIDAFKSDKLTYLYPFTRNLNHLSEKERSLYYKFELVEKDSVKEIYTIKIKAVPKQANIYEDEIYFTYERDGQEHKLKLEINDLYQYIGQFKLYGDEIIQSSLTLKQQDKIGVTEELPLVYVLADTVWTE